ncbi:hypothetical protein TIFTF001_015555 [Ficus carica]|uniref:Uncharacterized protein n=1 Tax=Ficus carica TaxID=3494 RepID=A0AA88A4P7_FICCA|nr:hypothetical protein TIFTF001_015555 [Ficus carica]
MGVPSAIRFMLLIAILIVAHIFSVQHSFVHADPMARRLGREVAHPPPPPKAAPTRGPGH